MCVPLVVARVNLKVARITCNWFFLQSAARYAESIGVMLSISFAECHWTCTALSFLNNERVDN